MLPIFLALPCCTMCVFAQQPAPSPSQPSDLFFPFSTVLRGPEEQDAVRLKGLLEQLDDVARAEVVVTPTEDGHRQALVILTWRAGRPSAVAAAWAADLALRVIRGLTQRALTVVDTSGRVWYGQQVALPVVESEPASVSGRPMLLGGALVVAAGAALIGLWRQRRSQRTGQAAEGGWVALSPRRVSKMLRKSSPAVRGVLLAALPPEMRGAVPARFRQGVELPTRAPDPEVLSLILAALGAESEEGRQ